MSDLLDALGAVVPAGSLLSGDEVAQDYSHDECLTVTPCAPLAVVRPRSTEEVAAVLALADGLCVPVTARGSGTGLSGAARPDASGIVVSFEHMDRVLEIDTENHVAVVQPGVRLDQLDEATAAHGLSLSRVSG